ncbi:putative ubiquitin-conjugating enzyme E2 38 [Tanacetum coccineum]
MEVEIDMLDHSDHDITKNTKHDDQDGLKHTNEAGSSGSPNSEMSYHEDDENDNYDDDALIDDGFDYDDDDDGDYLFDKEEEDDDDYDDSHYLSMQAQFDNVDLPPGVEANFSFLGKVPPAANSTPVTANTHDQDVTKDVASSSSSNIASSSEAEKEEVKKRYQNFKLFDIVDDFSDHHFTNSGFKGQQPPRAWTKKIQDEWKILEKDLPGTIFVRAYESRMDLLRAVIIGPAGTPYHDGLFVFDIHFPPAYPSVPPLAHYHAGGLRINPNLYDTGYVCLSLLNTWHGEGSENWMPEQSTMLQVLVSIQALILNEKPFFNEPGYESRFCGAAGEKESQDYNQNIFIKSLKTMIYTLRRPPLHFENLVAGHFRSRANFILLACRAYMEGAPVGSTINDGTRIDKSGSENFRRTVAGMINGLVSNFSRYGVTDLDQYRIGT